MRVKITIAVCGLSACAVSLVVMPSPSFAQETRKLGLNNVPESQQVRLANQAVFGRQGRKLRLAQGDELEYQDGKIIWWGKSAFFIVPAVAPEAWPSSIGALGIFYLEDIGGRFAVRSRFPRVADGSTMGNAPTWQISTVLSRDPILLSTSTAFAQGCSLERVSVIALRPGGPVTLVSYQSAINNRAVNRRPADRADAIESRISNIKKDLSFDVVYSGTRNFRQTYRRVGDVYQLSPQSPAIDLPYC
jgi:hypothetical protein